MAARYAYCQAVRDKIREMLYPGSAGDFGPNADKMIRDLALNQAIVDVQSAMQFEDEDPMDLIKAMFQVWPAIANAHTALETLHVCKAFND